MKRFFSLLAFLLPSLFLMAGNHCGYASRSIPVQVKGNQHLRIYLLDPGIVIQEVLVH